MRLFEVDQGSFRDILKVLQGLADKEKDSSELQYPVVKNILRPFGLSLNTTDAMIAFKNQFDPAGDVIDKITPYPNDPKKYTLVLKTSKPSQMPTQAPPDKNSATIDAMASSGAKKLTPQI
jgi:hypothetical protein